ncbi:hypothetical protein CA14_011957 [Aspergillus flavus]|uniref:F-box domain protein n=1 Tax=Aspergillus flavus TaxID=5059 RepID=A0AB74C0W3_ASPFL|nr:hypothetical protein CA14_011957 [Aspergillus flavus]
MTFALTGDILYIIPGILGDQRDYNSSYQCAVTSRCFTEPALRVLLYNSSPQSRGDFINRKTAAPRRFTLGSLRSEGAAVRRKWCGMWRSITLSALGRTSLPYYNYIRYLDLEGLQKVLGGDSRHVYPNTFFTPELDDELPHDYGMIGKERLRSSSDLYSVEYAVSKIGSETIHNCCPDFKQLTIHQWSGIRNAEVDSEKFLHELRPNTLDSFEVLILSNLGPRTVRALSSHWNSLAELKLLSLGIEAIAELHLLTAPPALKVLTLQHSTVGVYEEAYSRSLNRVADWIRSCKALQRLELIRFMKDDALLLAKVLPEESLRLSSLSVEGCRTHDAILFHEILHHQSSLQYLYLEGHKINQPEHNGSLVRSISQLNSLRELELEHISDGFTTDHLKTLTPCLPHLERLRISGEYFRDDALDAFLCLHRLQSLIIDGPNSFTTQGLLSFITQLGPGNRGFALSIFKSANGTDITEEAQKPIRELLESKLDGAFLFETDPEGN